MSKHEDATIEIHNSLIEIKDLARNSKNEEKISKEANKIMDIIWDINASISILNFLNNNKIKNYKIKKEE